MKTWPFLLIALLTFSCGGETDPVYKDYMRDFVTEISEYSREKDENFIIIPQNGHELVSIDGETTGAPHMDYLNAIDGAGQEELFYGYDEDDKATDPEDTEYLEAFLDICLSNGVSVLVTDYCFTEGLMDLSYEKNEGKGYLSFAAPDRELRNIPEKAVFMENDRDIESLKDASNFLYLINTENFNSKTAYIEAISATNYDVLIIDYYFDNTFLNSTDIAALKTKHNGGKRLLICYMSIGEAEDYRYYWEESWEKDPPEWLDGENRKWEGNYKVKYWYPEWQSIILGSESSYLDRILSTGFDGVYLDIIDAFEYYE